MLGATVGTLALACLVGLALVPIGGLWLLPLGIVIAAAAIAYNAVRGRCRATDSAKWPS